jgi:hypothetical protein
MAALQAWTLRQSIRAGMVPRPLNAPLRLEPGRTQAARFAVRAYPHFGLVGSDAAAAAPNSAMTASRPG